MCDYEIQQVLIKDIEWMTKTQQMAAERAERTAKYKLEQHARNEERKKRAEQQAQYKAEIKAKQEERRIAQQAKQREWELAQLEKLDEDPYESQIDLCEQLIYFCAKNKKRTEEQDDGPAQEESKEPTAEREEKKVDPKSGKIEVA